MCPMFSDDDRGKAVVAPDGESVGVVASVEGDIVHVSPDPGVGDRDASAASNAADDAVPIDAEPVREITETAVVLEDRSVLETRAAADEDGSRTEPAGGMSGLDETEIAEAMRDDDRELETTSRGIDVDTDETASREPEIESRTDAAVDPDRADARRTDAEVDPVPDEDESVDSTDDDGGATADQAPSTEPGTVTDPDEDRTDGSDRS